MKWVLIMYLSYNGLGHASGGPLVAEFATRDACIDAARLIREAFPTEAGRRYVCVYKGRG